MYSKCLWRYEQHFLFITGVFTYEVQEVLHVCICKEKKEEASYQNKAHNRKCMNSNKICLKVYFNSTGQSYPRWWSSRSACVWLCSNIRRHWRAWRRRSWSDGTSSLSQRPGQSAWRPRSPPHSSSVWYQCLGGGSHSRGRSVCCPCHKRQGHGCKPGFLVELEMKTHTHGYAGFSRQTWLNIIANH